MESTSVVSPMRLPRSSPMSLDREVRHQRIPRVVGWRGQTNDRLAALDQEIGGNMVAGDEIDVAAEQRLLRRLRTVAELKTHFEPVLLPNPGLVHHLPDRQMRMGAVEAADVHDILR
jgi:hypothetical protein